MGCMKCGRDVDPDQVFCDQCREVMARYPVKPGIVVQLPHRHQQPVKKQPARRHPVLSAECARTFAQLRQSNSQATIIW